MGWRGRRGGHIADSRQLICNQMVFLFVHASRPFWLTDMTFRPRRQTYQVSLVLTASPHKTCQICTYPFWQGVHTGLLVSFVSRGPWEASVCITVAELHLVWHDNWPVLIPVGWSLSEHLDQEYQTPVLVGLRVCWFLWLVFRKHTFLVLYTSCADCCTQDVANQWQIKRLSTQGNIADIAVL